MERKPNPHAARQGLIYGHKYLGVLESEVASNGPLLTESQEITIADIMLAVNLPLLLVLLWESYLGDSSAPREVLACCQGLAVSRS
jgi:hypothetical protein